MATDLVNVRTRAWACAFCIVFGIAQSVEAAFLVGHLRDPNWYARYQNNPLGVGYYEYAVNANAADLAAPGGADDTDIFGAFTMSNLAAGRYTIASWDVWWRSAYAFDVQVPASGTSADVDLRLAATMWGYPVFWSDTGYYEFGQTFVATGPISMIYLRAAFGTSYTLTVHEGAPGSGAQVGQSRSFSGAGDKRLIYGYGQMPTLAGTTYYLRVRTSSPSVGGVLRQMDPRPDLSDPMPGGCLWLGNGTTLQAFPDRDLGLVIMSDDDGLITDLFARPSGGTFTGVTSVGQTFVARGVGLISAAFWLADPAGPTYRVRVLEGGPDGSQVGTTKLGRPARLTADPEMLVTWSPGECPLTPGHLYYLEVTRAGGGVFNVVYINTNNPFAFGDAYRNAAPIEGNDLAGTLMEEESAGSAARLRVRIVDGPNVVEQERGANQLTIRWMTDVPSSSAVSYSLGAPPYQTTVNDSQLMTNHAVVLAGLQSHQLYHFQVRSSADSYRDAVSRDLALCTRPAGANLLLNPGFEEGSGPSPRASIPAWTVGGLDLKVADGSWFNHLPAHTGGWFLQGAVNGSESDGFAYQRITGLEPGREYRFSAWVLTWPLENGTTKYDVWNDTGRLIWMQLGIDPNGGTDPNGSAVQWTPRFYSHTHYSNPAMTARAAGTALTVFVRMKGQGGQWHLYGLDDCVLTPAEEGPKRDESFDSLPGWASRFDAPEGAPADFSLGSVGQPAPSLQVVRSAAGASARVEQFQIQPDRTYLISVYGYGVPSTAAYDSGCAFRVGDFDAQNLVEEAGSWTFVKRFANPGDNGNARTWIQYSKSFQSGSHDQLSVGFLSQATDNNLIQGRWDTLRIDELEIPTLSLSWEGAALALRWTGAAWAVESAPSPQGTWQLWSTNAPPVSVNPTGTGMFFRLAPSPPP